MDLVTVTVSSFNSSRTILETLDSILNQSWKYIELIIVDDASTDDTKGKCQDWIERNRNRFLSTEFLSAEKNMGIPSTFNRGIKAARGAWIKPIAGDDALMPNCIRDNMEYINQNPETRVLFSFNRVFRDEFNSANYLGRNPFSLPENIISERFSALDQYNSLLIGNKISFSPSLFINKEAVIDIGLADEDLFSEDYQLWLKLTKKGYKLSFMNKETVLYRKHDYSVNNTIRKYILKPHYFRTEKFRKRYIYPNLPADMRLFHRYKWIVNQIFRIDFFNKKNKFNYIMFLLLNVVFNPFNYIKYYKTHFRKQSKQAVFYQEF